MKPDILEIFEALKEIMTVSGYETVNARAVLDTAIECTGDFFTSSEISETGSVILYHRSKNCDAKTLLIDAHIDTIGLVVTEILEGGFVRTAPAGGIDKRNLATAEIEIYGKEKVRGIFSSVPPHLAGKDNTLPDFSDMLVDTGRSYDELCKIVSVGDPCVFVGKTIGLLGDRVSTAHLDDKICCAAIISACARVGGDADCNVTVLLSSGEETTQVGAKTASFITTADGAVALDVNFAKEKGVPDYQCSKLGDGAMISRSAVTDRRMTDILVNCAKIEGVKHKVIAETTGTGTNADVIEISNKGTPCAVLSVPIRYMHTPGEVFAVGDAECVSDILVCLMKNFDRLSREKETLLGVRILKGGSEI